MVWLVKPVGVLVMSPGHASFTGTNDTRAGGPRQRGTAEGAGDDSIVVTQISWGWLTIRFASSMIRLGSRSLIKLLIIPYNL